jgi:hypothetical protein
VQRGSELELYPILVRMNLPEGTTKSGINTGSVTFHFASKYPFQKICQFCQPIEIILRIAVREG